MKTIRYKGHKNIISQRLAEARVNAHMSQQDLAEKMQLLDVNIDQQAISKIELDNRIVTDYESLCFSQVLKVDLLWLLGVY